VRICYREGYPDELSAKMLREARLRIARLA